MKITIFEMLVNLLLASCAVAPSQTVSLSNAIGNDLQTLHISHRNLIQLHFKVIVDNINTFVDDTYAPYVIHRALESDLNNFKTGRDSTLFGSITSASEKSAKSGSAQALTDMTEFVSSAREQIETMRNELLTPILEQQTNLLSATDQSYENVIHANGILTGYLESLQKVKETQKQILQKVGFRNADSVATASLVKLSNDVAKALAVGNKIDATSNEAKIKIDAISDKIRSLTKIK